MAKRIIKNTMFIVFIVVVLCGIFILGVIYDYYNKELSEGMFSEAKYISKGVEAEGMEYLEELEQIETRVTWVDTDGTVLFDNKVDITTMDNHADREEIKEAMTSSAGNSVRYSNTISAKTVYHAIKLEDGSVIRLSHTQDSAFRIVLGMLHPILIVVTLALIISVLLAIRLTKQLVSPLDNIDLEHPDEAVVYEEMAPFVRRIIMQNKQIKKSMDDQQSQQREFRLITENMQEGFIVIDKTAKILSYNTSALKLFGVDKEVQYKNVLMLNRTAEFCKGVEVALQGRHHEQILPIGKKYYNIYINPVFNDENVAGAIIIVTDITETAEREKLRREFTANVSHELKTPLTSISGTAEIIKNGIVAPDDIPKFAGNIYSEAQRLVTLVEDIIRLSQLDEGTNIPEREELDLYYVSLEVAEQLRKLANKRNISVEVNGKSTMVQGVKSIITEMIYNICENAIKYNKENGRVTLDIGTVDRQAYVTVADTGIGIPENQQDRVFERFYRVDKSHSKEIGGTGLGLSIVKHGAKLHNAKIDLDSGMTKGTKITITFPSHI